MSVYPFFGLFLFTTFCKHCGKSSPSSRQVGTHPFIENSWDRKFCCIFSCIFGLAILPHLLYRISQKGFGRVAGSRVLSASTARADTPNPSKPFLRHIVHMSAKDFHFHCHPVMLPPRRLPLFRHQPRGRQRPRTNSFLWPPLNAKGITKIGADSSLYLTSSNRL